MDIKIKTRKDLEENGFIVTSWDFPNFRAVRKISGKEIGVLCRVNGIISNEEELKLIELWVKYDIHPFIARIKNNRIRYYDLLFSEDVNAI